MFVLSLVRQFCPDKLPVQPDERLGEGADGEVFTITGVPDKVLKLGILYEHHNGKLDTYYKHIQKTLDYLIETQPRAYARVYEHGYLGTYSRTMPYWRSGHQKFIIYYYTMEKLQKTTEDERKVFHSILSHEDRGIEKNFSTAQIVEALQGMSCGLDFDTGKVITFCSDIREASIVHLDIEVRNIMKDVDGNFKLIDFDRAQVRR